MSRPDVTPARTSPVSRAPARDRSGAPAVHGPGAYVKRGTGQ